MKNEPVPLVILAAGAGTRMGLNASVPKQLLTVNGMTLLQNAVNAALNCARARQQKGRRSDVRVVLGASAESIQSRTDLSGCRVLVNENWAAGMSGSIKLAVADVIANEAQAAGLILTMADQPYVSAGLLATLIAQHEEGGAGIVVSRFVDKGGGEKIPGPPAFFARQYFPELLQLDGDTGARKVVIANANAAVAVDFPEGGIDIDTSSDYQALLAQLG
ncbi:MAG: nucleotidyltransferase family protein [Cyanobacteria bacterium SZAS LIN-3]|nr:nucleotidyltransferase family protein [Cyanobacteria bacterium SZAS LIN-3]